MINLNLFIFFLKIYDKDQTAEQLSFRFSFNYKKLKLKFFELNILFRILNF
jgi:hypothetical protein